MVKARDTVAGVDDGRLLEVLGEAIGAVRQALDETDDWGLAGTRPGQYLSDLAADAAALEVLLGAGLGVVSEESGTHHPDRPLRAVLDPVDGSTNAARGLPWFATSIAVVDGEGLRAALVVNQASGERFEAVRGQGAFRDGQRMAPSSSPDLAHAMIGITGWPARHLGWGQMRALGSAALDICLVADGRLDAYVDLSLSAHGPWDYMGALLVCHEAGVATADVHGRELVTLDPEARRSPAVAATPSLLAQLLEAVEESRS